MGGLAILKTFTSVLTILGGKIFLAKVREHESEGSLDYFLLKVDEYMILNGVK